MAEAQKRQTAYKIRIKDLINGKYVQGEGWTPNYVITPYGKEVSRVNIIGVVVSKSTDENINYQSIILDDGSGKVPVRFFEKNDFFDNIGIGDVMMIIGRVREYSNEKYLLPEISKKVENKSWIDFRKAELDKTEQSRRIVKQEVKSVEEISQESIDKENNIINPDELIEFIKKRDKGSGVDFKDMLEIKNSENMIDMLLKEGDIFEVRPGRFKVLE